MHNASILVSIDDQARIEALRHITLDDIANADIMAGVRAALSSPTVEVRCAALRTWARCGLPSDETTRQNLFHRERRVRAAALHVFGHEGGSRGAEAFRFALRDTSPIVVLIAIHCTERYDVEVPIECFEALAVHPDAVVRARAALACLRKKQLPSLSLIRHHLESDRDDVRRMIIRCIGVHGMTDAVECVYPFISHEHPMLDCALTTLGMLGDRTRLRPLLSFLCSHEPKVRRAAQEALIRIGDPVIAPALLGALHDERQRVRHSALHILMALDIACPVEHIAKEIAFVERQDRDMFLHRLLRTDVETMLTRLRVLMHLPETTITSDIRSFFRKTIRQHPERTRLLTALAADMDVCMVRLLKPFVHSGEIMLPESRRLVATFAALHISRGTLLWHRAWRQLHRDGYSVETFFQEASQYAMHAFARDCLESCDTYWLTVYRTHAAPYHHARYLQTVLLLCRHIPDFAACFPAAELAWLLEFQHAASTQESEWINEIIALRHAAPSREAGPRVFRGLMGDPVALAAWLEPAADPAAAKIVAFHNNPCLQLTTAQREVFRDVIRTHPASEAVLQRLAKAGCPSVALTLLPWFSDGTLTHPQETVVHGMYELAAGDTDMMQVLIDTVPGTATPPAWCCDATPVHPHAAGGATGALLVPTECQ